MYLEGGQQVARQGGLRKTHGSSLAADGSISRKEEENAEAEAEKEPDEGCRVTDTIQHAPTKREENVRKRRERGLAFGKRSERVIQRLEVLGVAV
jgi:hypothetical protein